MRLIVAGTPEVAVPSLHALQASSHEIIAVITRPDAPAGRGRQLQRSPVAEWADSTGVPVLQPVRPRESWFLNALAELAPDCCPVIAYGALIPRAALNIPRFGWINLHFSLLPAWRGAAPVQHAIMAGDQITGASTFAIEEGLDTGSVYGVLTETIRADDTAGALLSRLADAGAGLMVATLDGVETGELIAVPQSSDGVSLAPKVTSEMAQVDWRQPALVIDRLIRGCTPAPGSWTTFRGERLGLGPIRIVGSAADTAADAAAVEGPSPAPGVLRVGKRAVWAGTGSGAVELGVVRPSGKREMAAADWARGARAGENEMFGATVSSA